MENENEVLSFGSAKDDGSFDHEFILSMTRLGNVGIGTNAPVSTLEIFGTLGMNLVNLTSDFTTVGNASVFTVDTTGGIVTVTLGTVDTVVGRFLIIKDKGGAAATNNITIDTQGSQDIDGDASGTQIVANFGSVRLFSDGSNWFTW